MSVQQTCITCKGNLFPYSKNDPEGCKCLPDDYEQCGECGFDHSYEWNEANKAHALLQCEQEKDTIPSPPSELTMIQVISTLPEEYLGDDEPTIPDMKYNVG